jgi:hypothetical protein
VPSAAGSRRRCDHARGTQFYVTGLKPWSHASFISKNGHAFGFTVTLATTAKVKKIAIGCNHFDRVSE